MEGKALNVLNSSVYHILERAKKTAVGEWQRALGGEYLKHCSHMGFGSRVSIITKTSRGNKHPTESPPCCPILLQLPSGETA